MGTLPITSSSYVHRMYVTRIATIFNLENEKLLFLSSSAHHLENYSAMRKENFTSYKAVIVLDTAQHAVVPLDLLVALLANTTVQVWKTM